MISCCLQGAIRQFAESVEIRRPRNGAYDEHGRWIDGPESTLQILASVQPARPDEIVKLVENRRSREAIVLYSLDSLQALSVEKQLQPDLVVWRDSTWEIESIEDWSNSGGYWKAIATRQGQ